MAHISTGELLRTAIKSGSALGQEAKKFLDKGALVPDAIVIGIVDEELKHLDSGMGFILDGFPRTVSQAEALDRLMSDKQRRLDRVVFLQVPQPVLIAR